MPDFVIHWLLWLFGISWLVIVLYSATLHILLALAMIPPTWRICVRAGFAGAWSLLHLLPVIGFFIVMAILAFGDWPKGEATPSRAAPRMR